MNKKMLSTFAILFFALILAEAADARRSSFRWRRLADASSPNGWCPDSLPFTADGSTASIQISGFPRIDMLYVVTREVFDSSQRGFPDLNQDFCDVTTYDPNGIGANEILLENFDDTPDRPWFLVDSTLIGDGIPHDPFVDPWPAQGLSGIAVGSGTVTVTLRDLTPGQEYVVGLWWIGAELELTVDTDHMRLLENDRFLITTSWRTPMDEGNAVVVPLTNKVGLFRFRDNPEDVDLFVRLDNGCSINGYFWVQVSGLTQAEATVIVTDSFTNRQLSFFNPLGTLFELRKDRRAFSCP